MIQLLKKSTDHLWAHCLTLGVLIGSLSLSACDDSSPEEPSATSSEGGIEASGGAEGQSHTVKPNSTPAVCGDQILAGDEECDDGNAETGDGCDPDCRLEQCGNGVVQFGERCDEGERNSDTEPNRCRLNCTFPRCGDGQVDQGEECDDANSDNADACRSTCVLARCGDGLLRAGLTANTSEYEECDHGVLNSDTQANACRSNCQFANCGDGVQDAGEECDLGSQNSSEQDSGASCRADCKLPRCGDGINDRRPECASAFDRDPPLQCGNGRLDAGEVCDEGSANHTDVEADGDYNPNYQTCRTNCQLARCGDGVRDLEEQCDDGNQVIEPCTYGEESCMVCGVECLWVAAEETSYCGDGELDPREQCDSGRDATDTSCTALCRFAEFLCGNGEVDGGEECDDGNLLDGDGCSFECKSECGNGELDRQEVCDQGALNQTDTCDRACSLGRALIRRGMTEHQGVIPVSSYDAITGDPIYLEGENSALYHDEYIFQNDGGSTLTLCFDFTSDAGENEPHNDDDLATLTSVFSVSLERITSLSDDADVRLDFIDETEEVISDRTLNAEGCLTLDAIHLVQAGVFKLKVGLRDLADLSEEDKDRLREREALRVRDREVHYQLSVQISREALNDVTTYGRVGRAGDDLYRLTLDAESKVMLRVTTDHLGRCPLTEEVDRPRLTVYNGIDELTLGAVRAEEVTADRHDRHACSWVFAEAWNMGQYWIKVDADTSAKPSGQYRLDAHISSLTTPKVNPTDRRAIWSSSAFNDRLSERHSVDGQDTSLEWAQRYLIEVPDNDTDGTSANKRAYQISASTFGCASGSLTQLEVWSLDDQDNYSALVSSAVTVDETDSEWSRGICQRLQTTLESGRYAVAVRHAEIGTTNDLTEAEVIARATLPYFVSIEQGFDLQAGGAFSAQLGVAPSADLPFNTDAMLGFTFTEAGPASDAERRGVLTGVQRFTLSLEEREEVHIDLTSAPNRSCELSYGADALNIELNLWLRPNQASAPINLRRYLAELASGVETETGTETSRLAELGIAVRDLQLTDCQGEMTLSLPPGAHLIEVSAQLEENENALPLTREQALVSVLPEYLLTLSRPALCGNTVIEGTEQCDDGNLEAHDYCDQCRARSICGDGLRELAESCDDGNVLPFDGCSPTCQRCGNGDTDPQEECDFNDSASTLTCDVYCTREVYDLQTSDYVHEHGAIAAGASDTFEFLLRDHAWLTVETSGCVQERNGSISRFDTVLKLHRKENQEFITESDDQETSPCAKITHYVQAGQGGEANLEVTSERLGQVIDYRLEIAQQVVLLSDSNGLCVKGPSVLNSTIPLDRCPEQSFTLDPLQGVMSGQVMNQHAFFLEVKRENYLGFSLKLDQGKCPTSAYVIGFTDQERNPIRVEFTESDDATTCANLSERPWPRGQYVIYVENQPEEGDQRPSYQLEAVLPNASEATCGNGFLEVGEECDLAEDGTVLGGDSSQDVCRDCRFPYCGDEVAEQDEECDEGRQNADDQACRSDCILARCGDGTVRRDLQLGDEGYEECDEGSLNHDDQACLSDCRIARCGDHFTRIDLQPNEEGYEVCDDGNTESGDGCSADCTDLERDCGAEGFVPSNQSCPNPSPVAVCGNNVIDDGEECDDNNLFNGDGCSSACQAERVLISSGLFQQKNFDQQNSPLHLYEISVDGTSRLVVETEGVSRLGRNVTSCLNGVADPNVLDLDTTLTLYRVDETTGELAQVVSINDDHLIYQGEGPDPLETRCSKLDLMLNDVGRYVIKVGAYGNEPLVDYNFKLQLARDLSRGLPLNGRLKSGEVDVYSLSLYDLQDREVIINTLRTHNDLEVQVIEEVSLDERDDPTEDPRKAEWESFPITHRLLSEKPTDAFGSGARPGDARSILQRVLILVKRDQDVFDTREYTIKLERQCGDGQLNFGGDRRYVVDGEECDDANTYDGDGCSAWCRLERNICGNGIVEPNAPKPEYCDPGHLLVDRQVPPDFAHPGKINNFEMTQSLILYFKEVETEETEDSDPPILRDASFTIDTRSLDYLGMSPDLKKIVAFNITEDENTVAELAQRINQEFLGLIKAWGRGDELSLIIRGGLQSDQVIVTLPTVGPWKQSALQPLCDRSCTPLRKRLVSSQRGEIGGVQQKKIIGKVDEGEEDLYLINLDDDFVLSVETQGCRQRTDTLSGVDTVISLYQLEQGEPTILVAESDDVSENLADVLDPNRCSKLENITLTKGSYALQVSGYLGSALEEYSLYYQLNRAVIELNATEPIVVSPEKLIYDEFSDQFDTVNHSFSKESFGVMLFTEYPEFCDTIVDQQAGRPSITLKQSPPNDEADPAFPLCTDWPAQTLDSSQAELSVDFGGEPTPIKLQAQQDFKSLGYIPLSYQYCLNPDECKVNKCGNGVIENDRDGNVAEEKCDDGNNIDDDLCTNTCRNNSYSVSPISSPGVNVNDPNLNLTWTDVLLGDDQVVAYPIDPIEGRTFKYFNRDYNTFKISSNGFIILENREVASPPVPTYLDNGCCSGGSIPLNTADKAIIAPYWEDLLGKQGSNRWAKTTISSLEEVLIIEWRDVEHYGDQVERNITMSVMLNLDSGQIQLYCENCQSDGGLHTQGLRGPYPFQGLAVPGRVRRNWSAVSSGYEYTSLLVDQ